LFSCLVVLLGMTGRWGSIPLLDFSCPVFRVAALKAAATMSAKQPQLFVTLPGQSQLMARCCLLAAAPSNRRRPMAARARRPWTADCAHSLPMPAPVPVLQLRLRLWPRARPAASPAVRTLLSSSYHRDPGPRGIRSPRPITLVPPTCPGSCFWVVFPH
jgi:hypothetical protein